MKEKAWFQLEMADENAGAERFEFVVFCDEVGYTEIFPHEIRALRNLKHQVEMMASSHNEMSFKQLVQQAKELQDTFRETVEKLGIKI